MTMQLSLVIFVSALLVGVAQGLTTTTPKPHGNNGDHLGDSFTFSYERLTHHMILSQDRFCYIAKLTSDELAKIHTNDGLLDIETRILSSIRNALAITLSDVNSHDLKHCGHNHEKYFLLHV